MTEEKINYITIRRDINCVDQAPALLPVCNRILINYYIIFTQILSPMVSIECEMYNLKIGHSIIFDATVRHQFE